MICLCVAETDFHTAVLLSVVVYMKSPPLYSTTLLFWRLLRSLPVRSLPVLWHGDDAELMGHLHHRGSSGGRAGGRALDAALHL